VVKLNNKRKSELDYLKAKLNNEKLIDEMCDLFQEVRTRKKQKKIKNKEETSCLEIVRHFNKKGKYKIASKAQFNMYKFWDWELNVEILDYNYYLGKLWNNKEKKEIESFLKIENDMKGSLYGDMLDKAKIYKNNMKLFFIGRLDDKKEYLFCIPDTIVFDKDICECIVVRELMEFYVDRVVLIEWDQVSALFVRVWNDKKNVKEDNMLKYVEKFKLFVSIMDTKYYPDAYINLKFLKVPGMDEVDHFLKDKKPEDYANQDHHFRQLLEEKRTDCIKKYCCRGWFRDVWPVHIFAGILKTKVVYEIAVVLEWHLREPYISAFNVIVGYLRTGRTLENKVSFLQVLLEYRTICSLSNKQFSI
jgi:hypothetical protein